MPVRPLLSVRLYELARGIDKSEVVPDRPTQSISAEDTFEQDVPLAETEAMIRRQKRIPRRTHGNPQTKDERVQDSYA